MKKYIASLAIALIGTQAFATPVNLVVNGGFEQTTNGAGKFSTNAGNTTAVGWTSTGYNFIYAANSADTVGAGVGSGNVKLWGPGDGSANGLTNSPTGGNFFAADGAYEIGPLQQMINGLVAGQSYNLSFDWAGAQQYAFTGVTTEAWQVSLGNATQTTQILTDPSHGFTGWYSTTFTFVATGSNELLSFLALGTPAGEPPFSLLDNVSLTAAVPEPGTLWAMLIGGLALLFIAKRRRKLG